jgi:Superinfection immunity protein
MNSDGTGAALGLVEIVLLIALYILPSIVAGKRGHPQNVAIFALNILLGWTFIGWVAALVWALTGDAGGSGIPVTLVDPGVTAQLECLLDDVEGRLTDFGFAPKWN